MFETITMELNYQSPFFVLHGYYSRHPPFYHKKLIFRNNISKKL
jgi:hypothetical protein